MPIKKDGTGKRWVEMELLLPGTPEQLWQAMATGAGNTGWFTTTEIEPRVGGVLRFDFGQGVVGLGEVTVWNPSTEFGYVERDWAPGAPPVATEITIVGRAGHTCLVRMVHSLFTTADDWDDQLEGFERGWPAFFSVLRVYLAHFAGTNAASFVAFAPASGRSSFASWLRLEESLGFAGANVGARCSSSSGPEPWSGIVEHVHQDAEQRYVLLRLDAPSTGCALISTSSASKPDGSVTSNVSVCRFFYGDDAIARRTESEASWRDWLNGTFATEEVAKA